MPPSSITWMHWLHTTAFMYIYMTKMVTASLIYFPPNQMARLVDVYHGQTTEAQSTTSGQRVPELIGKIIKSTDDTVKISQKLQLNFLLHSNKHMVQTSNNYNQNSKVFKHVQSSENLRKWT